MAGHKRKASEGSGQRRHFYKKLPTVVKDEKAIYVSETKTTVINSIIFARRPPLAPDPVRKKPKLLKKSPSPPLRSTAHRMLTRSATTSFARNAVFQTSELLESILLHLPLQDIITCRLISRHLASLIDRSLPILQRLFLKPTSFRDSWVFDTLTKTILPYNKLLEHEITSKDEAKRYHQSRPCILNPTIFERSSEAETGELDLIWRAEKCENLYFKNANGSEKRIDGLMSKTGWNVVLDMFVTQPPIREMHLSISYSSKNRSRYRKTEQGWVFVSPNPRQARILRLEVVNQYGLKVRDLFAAISAGIQDQEQWGGRVYGPDERSFRILMHGEKRSVMWMLGAMFVSEEEKEGVERLRVKEFLSEETEGYIRGMGRMGALDLGREVGEQKDVEVEDGGALIGGDGDEDLDEELLALVP